MKTNVVIIGAGPGGYETALYAKNNGLDVVLIEKEELGGVCLNAGCIPTKTFAYAASQIDKLKSLSSYGIDVNSTFNFAKLIEKKNDIIVSFRQGIASMLEQANIKLIFGCAELVTNHSVKVGNEIIDCDNIIIATGSTNKSVNFGTNLFDSSLILSMSELPKSLVIIGGGVIGIEFASAFNSFGCKVTVVEALKEILPNLDSGFVKRLRLLLKKKGIEFLTGEKVESINKENDYVIHLASGKSINSEKILLSIGRVPNCSALNLDLLDIRYDLRTGIIVNEFYQTNIGNIYAIGDVNGTMMLAHAATAQGKVAIDHILNKELSININLIPSIVYSSPLLASIGEDTNTLDRKEIKYRVEKVFYRSNGKAVTNDESEGLIQVLISEDNTILGCQIIGAEADTLIHEMEILIHNNAKVADLLSCIHAHPSLNEMFTQIK